MFNEKVLATATSYEQRLKFHIAHAFRLKPDFEPNVVYTPGAQFDLVNFVHPKHVNYVIYCPIEPIVIVSKDHPKLEQFINKGYGQEIAYYFKPHKVCLNCLKIYRMIPNRPSLQNRYDLKILTWFG